MLSKLLSPLKTSRTEYTPAEKRALESINTSEKCAATKAKIEAEISDTEKKLFASTQPEEADVNRLSVLRYAIGELDKALAAHRYDSEKKRIEAAIDSDSESLQIKLQEAKKALSVAGKELDLQIDTAKKIQARIEKLQPQLSAAKTKYESELATAEAAFDAAVSSGNDQQEASAAESLYRLKAQAGQSSGAIQIRLDALQHEAEKQNQILAEAEQQKASALEKVLITETEIGLLDFDKQANALIEAFVKHCKSRSKLSNSTTGFGIRPFALQFYSVERAYFGLNMDAVQNRTISEHALGNLARNASDVVDLKRLTDLEN